MRHPDELKVEYELLNPEIDTGCAVGKGELGTLYLSVNSPQGRVETHIRLHPKLAIALRDWLVKNYEGRET